MTCHIKNNLFPSSCWFVPFQDKTKKKSLQNAFTRAIVLLCFLCKLVLDNNRQSRLIQPVTCFNGIARASFMTILILLRIGEELTEPSCIIYKGWSSCSGRGESTGLYCPGPLFRLQMYHTVRVVKLSKITIDTPTRSATVCHCHQVLHIIN